MRSRPARSTPPDSGAFLFPLPLDPEDIFRVGTRRYQDRWFAGSIHVPGGVWKWVDRCHLRPYAVRLVEYLNISQVCRTGIELVVTDRYVLKGTPFTEAPANVALPMCKPLGLDEALSGLEKRAKAQVGAGELETLRWLEYFQSHCAEFPRMVERYARLRDLMR